jgi:hypothetical protein
MPELPPTTPRRGLSLSRWMLPHTHAWSRTQKVLIIAVSVVTPITLVALVYTYEREHPLPDASILVGNWEMTTPYAGNSSTFLRLDPEQSAAWHSGAWVRNDSSGQRDYSEMTWYAGGQYIYMRFPEGWPQIWQIIEIFPDELRLRHAKKDYVFKRWRDVSIYPINKAMGHFAQQSH